MKRTLLFLVVLLISLVLVACQPPAESEELGGELPDEQEVVEFTGKPSPVYSSFTTSKLKASLTFNGLASEKIMNELLNKLKGSKVKATFFIPGMRLAEEPELVQKIIAAGHTIGNNTLEDRDLTNASYEDIYRDIELSQSIFEKEIGTTPQFIRTRSGDSSENLQKVAAQLNIPYVIQYSVNPKDRDQQSAEELIQYVDRFLRRGSIVTLNTDLNPAVVNAIPRIIENAKKKGYEFEGLDQIAKENLFPLNWSEIAGADAIKVNPAIEKVPSNILKRVPKGNRQIALTFDDWASDETIEEILAILEHYQIQSTFFLIGERVAANPNLARVIVDAGHEVASHSYSHLDVTTMTTEELQEDLVKAHRTIAEAIQESPKLYFRPAQGKIDEERAKAVAAAGYPITALYDVTAFDWNETFTTDHIIERVLSKTTDGSIIVMHILDGTKTAEALPTIIENLQGQQYEFVKMSAWLE